MSARMARLYRMVLPDHVCPYGVQARRMLEQAGLAIEEHILSTRIETDAFMARLGVDSTPQVFIDGLRIGGCDELAVFLAEVGQPA